ncbi:MAG TPA: ZIP family metal transporter, partial [Candidatus Xenobia bacterium]
KHSCSSSSTHHPLVGQAAAVTLAVHSFFDGMGIGLAFQMSQAVGILVALAVVTHDFADGLNTVNLSLMHQNGRSIAWRLLLLDAAAPVLGALSSLAFHPGKAVLLGYLAFLTGFLLYISASEILPEAHRERPSMAALGMTLVGVMFIFFVARYI